MESRHIVALDRLMLDNGLQPKKRFRIRSR